MSDAVLDRPSRRGQRRTDTQFARGLALFDGLGVVKRRRQLTLYVSDDMGDLLSEYARHASITVAAAAAYLIEKQLREAIA